MRLWNGEGRIPKCSWSGRSAQMFSRQAHYSRITMLSLSAQPSRQREPFPIKPWVVWAALSTIVK